MCARTKDKIQNERRIFESLLNFVLCVRSIPHEISYYISQTSMLRNIKLLCAHVRMTKLKFKRKTEFFKSHSCFACQKCSVQSINHLFQTSIKCCFWLRVWIANLWVNYVSCFPSFSFHYNLNSNGHVWCARRTR